MINVIESLKMVVPIVGGPGMWQFVNGEFLSPLKLMDNDRMTTFTVKIGSKKIKLRTHLKSLSLMGGPANSGGRPFKFISQGHHDLWISDGEDNYSPSAMYVGKYDPVKRRGELRALSSMEIETLRHWI